MNDYLIDVESCDTQELRHIIIKKINDQLKFIRVVIDEAHRALSEPQTKRFLELMSRESRKYFAGITLADQTIKNFLIDPTLQTIWTNTNYKIFLKLGDEDIALLLEKKYATEQQLFPILKNPKKGKGVLVLQKGDVIDWHSKLTQEAVDLFGGGK